MTHEDRTGVVRMHTWARHGALVAMWLMTLVVFSVPNRQTPEGLSDLDPIAAAKVLAGLVARAILAYALLRTWRGTRRQRLAAWALVPLGLYTDLAIISTAWSPLKAVSLGQAGGLLVMYLLMATLAMSCRTEEDTEVVLKHLAGALALVCTIVLLATVLISPTFSGLNRDPRAWEGSLGLLHPTATGATTSLGLIVLIGSWLLWGWTWSSWVLLPAAAVQLVVLVLATSRTASAMAIVVLGIMFLTLIPRSWFGIVLVTASTLGATFLVINPTLDGTQVAFASGATYATRGESLQTISTLTGRTELWQKMWESYLDAPVLGHGYFVSSSTGEIDVWSGAANRTAHNVVLQALVTTGVIGATLFLWGRWRPARLFVYARRGSRHVQNVGFYAFLIAIWFLGWGQLSESFLGPIRPESVVFFTTLGVAIGNLSTSATNRTPQRGTHP